MGIGKDHTLFALKTATCSSPSRARKNRRTVSIIPVPTALAEERLALSAGQGQAALHEALSLPVGLFALQSAKGARHEIHRRGENSGWRR
jgi:hypothetical protein